MTTPEVLRYTAFSSRPEGGNPAGVVLDAGALDADDMQRIAADVDYAETAFVTATTPDGGLAIRYFSPIAEVPFCGHATVATAVALAERGRVAGDGAVRFHTPVGVVAIEVSRDDDGIRAAFTSVEPRVRDLDGADLDAILGLLGLTRDDLDDDLPPRLANTGNTHPVIVLGDPARFDGFSFDPDAVRALMNERGWPATITVAFRAEPHRFQVRNLFPVGRITEDPATGSAAASLGAYLRSLGAVPVPSTVVIEQGGHVGRPGELAVQIPASGGITVSGMRSRSPTEPGCVRGIELSRRRAGRARRRRR